ncbi:hypothetical protein [Aequorivita sinensis]|uniref:hypothetical protein n=1 Tax=Aequorivita sinensis TaxID=1382458 RepID=UPI0011236073|nr:hypothetical protein [Aequorivita sinensis]
MENLNNLYQTIMYIGGVIYAYCTDFTINLANLTGTSYYEINFFFFCVLFPFLIIVLPVIAVILKFRLRSLKKRYGLY